MSKKEYFEKEEEFLKKINQDENKFLSKSTVEGVLNLTPELLIQKKLNLEYCDFSIYEDGIVYYDTIFRSKSDIFIYLSKKDNTEKNYKVTLYFEPTKLEETKFFIKNLNKIK